MLLRTLSWNVPVKLGVAKVSREKVTHSVFYKSSFRELLVVLLSDITVHSGTKETNFNESANL